MSYRFTVALGIILVVQLLCLFDVIDLPSGTNGVLGGISVTLLASGMLKNSRDERNTGGR